MIKELVKVATRLDALGLTKEADVVDRLIRKIATEVPYGETPVSLKSDYKDEGFATFSDDEEDEFRENPEDMFNMHRYLDNRKEFNPHLHGDSYEMDTADIEEELDENRRLDRMHEGLNEMFPAVHSFRRSSSTRRGMRKSS